MILHVMPEPFWHLETSERKYEARINAENQLEEWRDSYSHGAKAEYSVIWGNPPEEILKFSENYDTDLIVMATHGRSGIGRFLLGSVAEQVIRYSSCPVLAIRGERKKDIGGSF
jgi:nucleotide-binding universal stress UspA family protein